MTTDFRRGNASTPFSRVGPIGSSADPGHSNGGDNLGAIRAETSLGLKRLVRIFR
jgi:hypothetical protein